MTTVPSKAEPSAGAARRTGRGHIASYGDDRRCSKPGCTTTLSRYNSRSVCAAHDEAEGRSAG